MTRTAGLRLAIVTHLKSHWPHDSIGDTRIVAATSRDRGGTRLGSAMKRSWPPAPHSYRSATLGAPIVLSEEGVNRDSAR
jgi:hypothetical protein